MFVIYADAERKKERKLRRRKKIKQRKLCRYKERRKILLEKGNIKAKKRRKQGSECHTDGGRAVLQSWSPFLPWRGISCRSRLASRRRVPAG